MDARVIRHFSNTDGEVEVRGFSLVPDCMPKLGPFDELAITEVTLH